MGCSPPDWVYEQAEEDIRKSRERERNTRVNNVLTAVQEMTAQEKLQLLRALGLTGHQRIG